jgi:hypothetical protein
MSFISDILKTVNILFDSNQEYSGITVYTEEHSVNYTKIHVEKKCSVNPKKNLQIEASKPYHLPKVPKKL